ncbi:MAG: cyanophycin synthetase [Candidatus Taylorbacteria bacterium]|nr:cyanophycin synthetase [Candidatus Taylorbacteria bacterium]
MNRKNRNGMKKKESLVGRLFEKIAPKIGATVHVEPEWGVVGQITYKSGRRRYFRWSSLDLNSLGASEIARDKDYANYFMKRMNYPTIEGKTFYSNEWARKIKSDRNVDAAYLYARKLGFPVIIKPNSRSQGNCVSKANTRAEFYKAMSYAFKQDRVVIVQRYVSGKDYRVVVLDDRVISAYERIPLFVVGDGTSTINELLEQKQKSFVKSGRDTIINTNDFRTTTKLKRSGLDMESVLELGAKAFLLDNANLSTGGDSVDVTDVVSECFKELAISITKDMGLRLCGVDLMIDGSIEEEPRKGKHWIIEINSAPGLDHYCTIGKAQEKIVEDLYLEVLKAMEH